MSGTIKVRRAAGWGLGVGLEENIDRNRVGVQKEDAMSAELALIQRVAIELVGGGGGLSGPLPRALGQPARTLAGPWRAGRVLGLCLRGHPGSKCSSELIAFPGL